MSKLGLNFAHPRAEPIQAALDNANRQIDGWAEVAYAFLRKYCRENEHVFAEDVTAAADVWGLIPPPTTRAWGGIYIRAQHEFLIASTGNTRKRKNGSLATVYQSLLWKAPR